MFKRIVFYTLSVLLIVISLGCARATEADETAVEVKGNVQIQLVNVIKKDFKNNTKVDPYILVIVKNTGNAVAYSLTCDVNLQKDAEVLQSQSVDLSSNLSATANLSPNEETWFEVSFSSVKSHLDYDNIAYDFKWREAYNSEIVNRLSVD